MGVSARGRVREILPDIYLGRFATGVKNSLTDVPGVLVSTAEIKVPNSPGTHAINTGVTTILPRRDFFDRTCFAGIFRFNGSGEMTGSHWIEETGLLQSPILITNSFATGAGIQGVLEWCVREHKDKDGLVDWFTIPVIAETCDLWLNDIAAFPITPKMVVQGIDDALRDGTGPVKEGNTGGGCGMICSWWKGGTGSASRLTPGRKRAIRDDGRVGPLEECQYTVAALVQANYGRKMDFRFGGVPIGRFMAEDEESAKLEKAKEDGARAEEEETRADAPDKMAKDGSIIIVLATDAPLSPLQLQRLAKRGTVGLARAGGIGHNTSGDVFIAFSTAARIPALGSTGAATDPWTATPIPYTQVLSNRTENGTGTRTGTDMETDGKCDATYGLGQGQVDDYTINSLFEATADAVEESIYNAVTMAETMEGPLGRVVRAIDLDELRHLWSENAPRRKPKDRP